MAPAPAAALPALAAAPALFALTPSLQNTGFLNWSKSENVKIYSQAIEKLDFKFEGKVDQVILPAQAVQNRAELRGFNCSIMTIPDGGSPYVYDQLDAST